MLRSYLDGRRQRTKMTKGMSNWQSVESGVPQGSVWGPLLFTLYTADMGQHVTAAELVTYADDVTLVTSHKDPEKARARMDVALEQLATYARRNRIAPEPSKTQLMVSAPAAKMKFLKDFMEKYPSLEFWPYGDYDEDEADPEYSDDEGEQD